MKTVVPLPFPRSQNRDLGHPNTPAKDLKSSKYCVKDAA